MSLSKNDEIRKKVKDFAIMASHDNLENLNLKESEVKSQISFYRENGASPKIMKHLEMNSTRFGHFAESHTIKVFNLTKRSSPQHDCMFGTDKIEIKSSRYWNNTFDGKFQHIEPSYDYGFIICMMLALEKTHWYIISKSEMLKLYHKGVVKKQGKQGLWFTLENMKPYMSELIYPEILEEYIQKMRDPNVEHMICKPDTGFKKRHDRVLRAIRRNVCS